LRSGYKLRHRLPRSREATSTRPDHHLNRDKQNHNAASLWGMEHSSVPRKVRSTAAGFHKALEPRSDRCAERNRMDIHRLLRNEAEIAGLAHKQIRPESPLR